MNRYTQPISPYIYNNDRKNQIVNPFRIEEFLNKKNHN